MHSGSCFFVQHCDRRLNNWWVYRRMRSALVIRTSGSRGQMSAEFIQSGLCSDGSRQCLATWVVRALAIRLVRRHAMDWGGHVHPAFAGGRSWDWCRSADGNGIDQAWSLRL